MERMEPTSSDTFSDQETVGTLKKGPWTSAEDAILISYVQKHGEGNWNAVQKQSGLSRCGKSCRLRWANHLRPNLRKGAFTQEEECLIIDMHQKLGNKWARMAAQLPGRTDNEIKNYWNTRIKRRLRAGLPVYPSDTQTQRANSQQHAYTGNALQELNVHLVSGSNGESDISRADTEINGLNVVNIGGSCHLRLSSCASLPTVSCNIPATAMASQGSINVHTTLSGVTAGSQIQRGKRERESHSNSFWNSYASLDQPTEEISMSLQPYLKRRNCSKDSLRQSSQGFVFHHGISKVDVPPQFEVLSTDYHSPGGFYEQSVRSNVENFQLELPSCQSAESESSTGTAQLAAPPTDSVTDSFSSNTHCFLEALLHQAATTEGFDLLPSELVDQLMPFTSNSSPSDIVPVLMNSRRQLLVGNDSSNLVECAELFVFNGESDQNNVQNWEALPITQHAMGTNFMLKSNTCKDMPLPPYTDEELSTLLDFAKPDPPSVHDWYSFGHSTVTYDDATAGTCVAPVDQKLINIQEAAVDLEQLISEQVAMNHVWELESCHWNNMPGACQVGDLATDCRAFPTVLEQYNDSCAIY